MYVPIKKLNQFSTLLSVLIAIDRNETMATTPETLDNLRRMLAFIC